MISDLIKSRLKKAGKRYYASDNIAEFLHEGEKEKLVEELTEKFSGVLDSLVITSKLLFDKDKVILNLSAPGDAKLENPFALSYNDSSSFALTIVSEI